MAFSRQNPNVFLSHCKVDKKTSSLSLALASLELFAFCSKAVHPNQNIRHRILLALKKAHWIINDNYFNWLTFVMGSYFYDSSFVWMWYWLKLFFLPDGLGDWRTDGCEIIERKANHTVIHVYHLSYFAILQVDINLLCVHKDILFIVLESSRIWNNLELISTYKQKFCCAHWNWKC